MKWEKKTIFIFFQVVAFQVESVLDTVEYKNEEYEKLWKISIEKT